MITDGSLIPSRQAFQIQLASHSEQVLKTLALEIGYKNKLCHHQAPVEICAGGKQYRYVNRKSLLYATSPIFCENIQRFGKTPGNKVTVGSPFTRATVVFPDLDLGDNIRYFLRGCLEGDGCISTHISKSTGQTAPQVAFCGTHELILGIQTSIKRLCNLRAFGALSPMRKVKSGQQTYQLQFRGWQSALEILRYIYDDPDGNTNHLVHRWYFEKFLFLKECYDTNIRGNECAMLWKNLQKEQSQAKEQIVFDIYGENMAVLSECQTYMSFPYSESPHLKYDFEKNKGKSSTKWVVQ